MRHQLPSRGSLRRLALLALLRLGQVRADPRGRSWLGAPGPLAWGPSLTWHQEGSL